jgi:hypothetical protein
MKEQPNSQPLSLGNAISFTVGFSARAAVARVGCKTANVLAPAGTAGLAEQVILRGLVSSGCALGQIARPNQSLKRRPATAGHLAGQACHVYHRLVRPGVHPPRSA